MHFRGFPVATTVCAAAIALAMLLQLTPGGAAEQAPIPSPPQSESATNYKLGSGDRVRVTVFGEDDLGGQFDVDGAGTVQLPLIGQVQASGLTAVQFAEQVKEKLADGYLRHPTVTVDIITYRPFYIIGEVSRPGEYPYVNGMSVLNAVARAGGYTNRADVSTVYIRRDGASREQGMPADQTTKVGPGDIVRVRERFF